MHVDDVILIASLDKLHQSIMSRLSSEFSMKDLGHLSYFLRIAVNRHISGLFLLQNKYDTKIIEQEGMSSCMSSSTPMDTKPNLGTTRSKTLENPSLYRSFARALQYLTFTRPDITYVIQ